MRRRSLLACLLAAALAGCGGGGGEERGAVTTVTTVTSATPRPSGASGQIAAGERVVDDSGCLACHQIGARGNSGPGSNLAGIGDRMPAAAIRRSLTNPPARMPSYRQLSRDRLDALVAYLSSLRSDCPDGSDCG